MATMNMSVSRSLHFIFSHIIVYERSTLGFFAEKMAVIFTGQGNQDPLV